MTVNNRTSRLGVVAAGALSAMLAAMPAAAQLTTASDSQGEYALGRVLVGARAGLSSTELGKIVGAQGGRARAIGQTGLYVVELPTQASETAVMQQLARNPALKFAELDRKVKPAFTANDPYMGSAWHIPKTGTSTAWDTTQGSGITIAILDTGVDGTHPDLSARMVPGWNAVNNSSNTSDFMGHGTPVAGAAAATTNNGTGVAGMAGQARIMPIVITDSSGGAYYSVIAQAITYAADHGARVASISMSGLAYSSAIQSAAQYMKGKGGLVVVAAGNSGTVDNVAPTTAMIPVSATLSDDSFASWSTYGSFVAMSAPGYDIQSTGRGGVYGSYWGTSLATPIVSGAIALIMAAKPSLTSAEVENLLYKTAVDLGAAGRDSRFGYGRVDAGAAVKAALGSSATPADTTAPTAVIAAPLTGATVSGSVPVDVSASDNVGVSRVELRVNGVLYATDTSSPYAFSWSSTGVANGSVNLQAVAYDAAGNAGASSTATVMVSNVTAVVPPPTSDTTPPAVRINNPTGGTIGNRVSISASATDDSGASGITESLYIDGVLKATAIGGSLSYNWNTRKVASGAHTIQVIARDAAGNSSSATVQVTK